MILNIQYGGVSVNLKSKLILFTISICIISILCIFIINYMVAIDQLKNEVKGKIEAEVCLAILKYNFGHQKCNYQYTFFYLINELVIR